MSSFNKRFDDFDKRFKKESDEFDRDFKRAQKWVCVAAPFIVAFGLSLIGFVIWVILQLMQHFSTI